MSAPTGNSNATKWTEERTITYLKHIEKFALRDNVLTLSNALVKARIYKGIWTYWKHRWEYHEDIMDRILYIEQIFMMKIEENALTKRWHAGMCMFMLRVNYGQGEQQTSKNPYKEKMPSHLSIAHTKAQMAKMFPQTEEEHENETQQEQEQPVKAPQIVAEKEVSKPAVQADTVAKPAVNADKADSIPYADEERRRIHELYMSQIADEPEVPVVDITRGWEDMMDRDSSFAESGS